MRIFYDRKVLFIAVTKTAGSSIQRALDDAFGHDARWTRRNRLRRRLTLLGPLNRVGGLYRAVDFPVHVTARTVRSCLPPQVYDSMFKFAFVRNPWDRLVSWYGFLQKQKDHRYHQRVKGMKSFEEFLQWETGRGDGFSQYHAVCDAGGKLIVDFIGYYERLNEDFARVCSIIGSEVTLPHLNRSVHKDYREYYTAETRELVARHYHRDIELFGYDFDGIAGG
ncbi:MAG TPA: sulfotransferase family 2 domain-containing protein [Verrucomicrobiae bacterium]|nr:sulfotransferase family 2 domain-containing protein [Verrucomicrobiae bacterium]